MLDTWTPACLSLNTLTVVPTTSQTDNMTVNSRHQVSREYNLLSSLLRCRDQRNIRSVHSWPVSRVGGGEWLGGVRDVMRRWQPVRVTKWLQLQTRIDTIYMHGSIFRQVVLLKTIFLYFYVDLKFFGNFSILKNINAIFWYIYEFGIISIHALDGASLTVNYTGQMRNSSFSICNATPPLRCMKSK